MQKKIILLLLPLLVSIPVFSQIPKNSWLLGGNLTGKYVTQSRIRDYNINLNPQVGYLIGNNLCLGVAFPLDYTFTNYGNFSLPTNVGLIRKNGRFEIAVSPFLRKYFGKGKMKPFVQANLLYSSIRTSQRSADLNIDVVNRFRSTGAGIGIGANYFVNDRLALESVLDFTRKYDDAFRFRFPSSELRLRFGLVMFLSRQSPEK